jgi:hypothetical protein
VQAFKAFAPHGGLVAGELIAGCNDNGVGDFVLFGRAHLAGFLIFLRSSSKEASKEASMLHDAGWSNVTAKRCSGGLLKWDMGAKRAPYELALSP